MLYEDTALWPHDKFGRYVPFQHQICSISFILLGHFSDNYAQMLTILNRLVVHKIQVRNCKVKDTFCRRRSEMEYFVSVPYVWNGLAHYPGLYIQSEGEHRATMVMFWDNFTQSFTILSIGMWRITLVHTSNVTLDPSKIRNGCKSIRTSWKFDLVGWVLSVIISLLS